MQNILDYNVCYLVSGEIISGVTEKCGSTAGLFVNKDFIYGVISAPYAWD